MLTVPSINSKGSNSPSRRRTSSRTLSRARPAALSLAPPAAMLVPSLTATCAVLALLATSGSAAAVEEDAPTESSPSLVKRASPQTTLAPGTSYTAGFITRNFRWQSSGILAYSTGGCPPNAGLNIEVGFRLKRSGGGRKLIRLFERTATECISPIRECSKATATPRPVVPASRTPPIWQPK